MSATLPTDDELQFYYFGFYAVLKRYRFMTLLGWLVVAGGFVCLMFAWNAHAESVILETIIGCGCCAAGLALVQNSVASLSAYVTVPFRSSLEPPADAGPMPVILQVTGIMKDVEEGGWQEAYAAIRRLEEYESAYGLPPLSAGGR